MLKRGTKATFACGIVYVYLGVTCCLCLRHPFLDCSRATHDASEGWSSGLNPHGHSHRQMSGQGPDASGSGLGPQSSEYGLCHGSGAAGVGLDTSDDDDDFLVVSRGGVRHEAI